jgi:hypothetical protein
MIYLFVFISFSTLSLIHVDMFSNKTSPRKKNTDMFKKMELVNEH